MYLLAAIAVAFWLSTLYKRYKLWHIGKPDDCTKDIGKRIWVFIRTIIVDVLAHRRFLRNPYSGIMHLIIFWGFIILLLGSAIDAFTYYSGLHLKGNPYLWFSLIVDIGGLLILAGTIMAAYRRYIWRPEGLVTIFDDGIVLSSMALILITGYMVEGLRMAATEINSHPEWAVWSPGGLIMAKAFSGMNHESLLSWHKFMWWFHALLSIGAFVYVGLVFSKLQHIIVSPLNIFFRSLGPVAVPSPIDIENPEALGVGNIRDFTWKQLLDLDACTNCGRCQDTCPAWATGKPLSPRKVIQDLKIQMLKEANKRGNETQNAQGLVGEAPSEEEIWSCTTCAACQEICPVYVEHIVKIIDLRRHLVLAQSRMPETAQVMLRNMQSRGHPWAGIQSLRLRGDWTTGLELKILMEGDSVNTLFWVGCTGALAERNVEATLSMIRVLKMAGVDFGVLGNRETCCGDPARRAGYEFQFQIMAEQNIEIFKSHNIKEIITTCPHCYNTIKNEYTRFGGDFKVIHYTELIYDFIRQGKLEFHRRDSTFTYQDPCYLGRYNGIYIEPRHILDAISSKGLREMNRSKNLSFCCGGGGGHMWIEEMPGTTKINQMRIEDVIKTGAEIVVTSCPYCLQMFEEGIEHKNIKERLKARDIIEVVEEALKKS